MRTHIVDRLRAKGVTPAQALVDIERSPHYAKFIASDDGQELLEWLADEALAARRGETSQTIAALSPTEAPDDDHFDDGPEFGSFVGGGT